MDGRVDEVLRSNYYDPKNFASFGGVDKLSQIARTQGISKAQVRDWLLKQPVYTSFRAARKRYPLNWYYSVKRPMQEFELDLLDVGQWAQHNNSVRYLIVAIDCFSRKLFVRPVKTKRAAEVAQEIDSIFREAGGFPKTVRHDDGNEFRGETRLLFSKNNVKVIVTINTVHASIVERVNRTLREKLSRFMYASNTKRYLPVLQNIVSSINESVHSSIEMSPNSVRPHHSYEIYKKLYMKHLNKNRKVQRRGGKRLKVGQRVRLSKLKPHFAKGSAQSFTEEIFTVSRVYPAPGPTGALTSDQYEVQDDNTEKIIGKFYREELMPVVS